MRRIGVRARTVRGRVARALILLVCGAVALTGCDVYDIPLPGGADVGSNPMKLHVEFRDVLDLVPQSTVKVDDVTVGKITSIKLKGYTADVTIEVPGDMKIPANERADIRQTSLLGEKFISLEKPDHPSSTLLRSGDVIPLSQTGRNPQVEEVLKALSAVLNGGGVAQLKTIAVELNKATGGREQDIRSVLDQIHYFMSQLDRNKAAVVSALDNVNRLAKRLHGQDATIKKTLDDLPAAVRSVNQQRHDLIQMLHGLSRLSDVGVRVIRASKAATIDSLQDLAPVLNAFARAGADLPKSLQVLLTYPFLDAAVGNSPTVARNLHMGDWVNLSILLNLDLDHMQLPGLPNPVGVVKSLCKTAPSQLSKVCDKLIPLLDQLGSKLPSSNKVTDTISKLLDKLRSGLLSAAGSRSASAGTGGSTGGGARGGNGGSSGGGNGGSGGLLGGVLGGLGLGRADLGSAYRKHTAPADAVHPDRYAKLESRAGDGIGALLVQGVTRR